MKIIQIPVGELQANCYLVYDENGETAMIDPGDNADWILQTVQRYHLHVTAVLLTHVHFDHYSAAKDVLAATGAPFLVPKEDVPALSDPHLSMGDMAPPADRVLTEGDCIEVGTLTLRVLHTPGHTPGGSCYLCEDAIFTGDTLFADGVGRTDFPGGDEAALMDSLRRLKSLKGTYTAFPGHFGSTALGDAP